RCQRRRPSSSHTSPSPSGRNSATPAKAPSSSPHRSVRSTVQRPARKRTRSTIAPTRYRRSRDRRLQAVATRPPLAVGSLHADVQQPRLLGLVGDPGAELQAHADIDPTAAVVLVGDAVGARL